VLDVPGWPGHAAGQHVDIRLTAEDGYQAQRSYSIASGPDGADLELTVEEIADGEVSPYLTGDARPGDGFELRGPIGGYFVWHPGLEEPLLLVGGGSGLVPLMAMLRHRRAAGSAVDARLLLSAGTLEDVLYRSEVPPSERPRAYVCGPTPFVEEAARLLVELGHEPASVHTERFGPTGG
jgi:ferredoxin-NADP reductase